jgi:GDP-mannose 6-dehydrogenase
MKIAVYGLGNVGLVAALGFCEQGHKVVGIEINENKIKSLIEDKIYIQESGLDELLKKHKGNIEFKTKLDTLIDIDTAVVCVGTPTQLDGKVYLNQVKDTINEIVKNVEENKTIDLVLRSTIPPGTIDKLIKPIISKKKNISFLYHPEFLREGSALEDFLYPELHVIGVKDGVLQKDISEIFLNTENIKLVEYKTAEMIKYLNNSFHALKVSYVNEIASIASSYDVNVDEMIDCFLSDQKLNISKKYLKPGFAFGGPCLTKDVKALDYLAKEKQIETPIVSSIMESNNKHLFRVFGLLEKINPKSILFFGISFKEGTNDLRSSPTIDLINLLQKRPSYIAKKEIYIIDSDHALNEMKEYENCKRLKSIKELKSNCDVLVLGTHVTNSDDEKYINNFNGTIIDLGYKKKFKINENIKLYKAYEAI